MENAPVTQGVVKPDIPIVNGSLQPTSFEQLWRVARLMAATKMVPEDYQGKAEELMVALMFGMDVGLSVTQAPQNVAVIGGRPVVWGDAAKALVDRHPALEDFHESYDGEIKVDDKFNDGFKAVCMIKRKGRTPVVRSYSIGDAKQAGLWMKKTKGGKDTPWVTHPKRMLQMRARAFAMRDSFADALKGLSIYEEVADVHGALVDAGNGQLVFEAEKQLPAPSPQKEQAPRTEPQSPDKLLYARFLKERGLTMEEAKEAPIVGIFSAFMAESCEGEDRMVVCQKALSSWDEFYSVFNDYADSIMMANAQEQMAAEAYQEGPPATEEGPTDSEPTVQHEEAPAPPVAATAEDEAVSTKRGDLYSKLPKGLKVNALSAFVHEVMRRNECSEEAVLDTLLGDIKATATALLQWCTSSNIEVGYGYQDIKAISTVVTPPAPAPEPVKEEPPVTNSFRKAWEMLGYEAFMNFFMIKDNHEYILNNPEEMAAAEARHKELAKKRGIPAGEFPFKRQRQDKIEFGQLKGSKRFQLAQIRKKHPAIVDPILSKFGNSGIPASETKINAIMELVEVELKKIGAKNA